MSRTLNKAGLVSVGLAFASILFSAEGSGASAQDPAAVAVNPESTQAMSQPAAQPLPLPGVTTDDGAGHALAAAPVEHSLAGLVAARTTPDQLSRELRCLAGAIYFESKSEPLEGQYAVARVIVARSKSGRYPSSYCGVVYQPSQFSFVHAGTMPAINAASHGWHDAVAIAQLADADSWHSPVEGALSFHAARVSPGWRMTRMARLGNHVFYR